jgi:hypothetical protein
MISAGKNETELTDSQSKNYFLNKVPKRDLNSILSSANAPSAEPQKIVYSTPGVVPPPEKIEVPPVKDEITYTQATSNKKWIGDSKGNFLRWKDDK